MGLRGLVVPWVLSFARHASSSSKRRSGELSKSKLAALSATRDW